MKPKKAWAVLNRNGNTPVHIAEAVFSSKESAEHTAAMWMQMENGRNGPNAELTVHRVVITLAPQEEAGG